MSMPWRWTAPATSTPGATFTTAGGVAANHIAKWNGSAWSALGSGMGGDRCQLVYALAVDGAGNLYAGGYFTTAGGVAANHIAKWNGSAWSALGSGMSDGAVAALAVDGAGNLYAGGYFTTAGGVAANRIAKWNGSAWSALGSGMDGMASMPWRWTAPATSTPGALQHRWRRGGEPHRQVGRQHLVCPGQRDRWRTVTPSVTALAVDGTGNLYAGGGFTTAGGKPSANIGRWELTARIDGG